MAPILGSLGGEDMSKAMMSDIDRRFYLMGRSLEVLPDRAAEWPTFYGCLAEVEARRILAEAEPAETVPYTTDHTSLRMLARATDTLSPMPDARLALAAALDCLLDAPHVDSWLAFLQRNPGIDVS